MGEHRRQVGDGLATLFGVVAVLAAMGLAIVGSLWWPGP